MIGLGELSEGENVLEKVLGRILLMFEGNNNSKSP